MQKKQFDQLNRRRSNTKQATRSAQQKQRIQNMQFDQLNRKSEYKTSNSISSTEEANTKQATRLAKQKERMQNMQFYQLNRSSEYQRRRTNRRHLPVNYIR